MGAGLPSLRLRRAARPRAPDGGRRVHTGGRGGGAGGEGQTPRARGARSGKRAHCAPRVKEERGGRRAAWTGAGTSGQDKVKCCRPPRRGWQRREGVAQWEKGEGKRKGREKQKGVEPKRCTHGQQRRSRGCLRAHGQCAVSRLTATKLKNNGGCARATNTAGTAIREARCGGWGWGWGGTLYLGQTAAQSPRARRALRGSRAACVHAISAAVWLWHPGACKRCARARE